MAEAQGGGSGWTILTWSNRFGRLVNLWAADHAQGLPGGTPILALEMYEHAYQLDFGAKAGTYVDQIMAKLNWERIGARYRSPVGDGKAEDELFLRCGAPVQAEARISAEELKAASEDAEEHRPVLFDLSQPRDLPRRTDSSPAPSCTLLPRWPNGSSNCRGTGRSRCIAFAVSRPAARPSPNCAGEVKTRGLSLAASPPGTRSADLPCRSIPRPTSRHRNVCTTQQMGTSHENHSALL